LLVTGKPGLSLRADAKASAEKVGALSADKEYSSSDPAIRATKPTISEILIGYSIQLPPDVWACGPLGAPKQRLNINRPLKP